MKPPSKDLNFLPASILEAYRRHRRRLLYTPAVLLGVLLLGAALYLPVYLAEIYRDEIDRHWKQYAELAAAQPVYEKLQSLEAEFDRQHKTVQGIEDRRVEVAQLIDGISDILPPGVWVVELEVLSGRGVFLKFESSCPLQTARLIVGLRQLGFFERVEPEQVLLRPGEVELKMPFKGHTWDEDEGARQAEEGTDAPDAGLSEQNKHPGEQMAGDQ